MISFQDFIVDCMFEYRIKECLNIKNTDGHICLYLFEKA